MYAQAAEPRRQKVPDTAGTLAGQKDEHAVPGANQGGHTHVEKINRQLLILPGEVNPFGLTGRSGGVERHHPIHFAL